MQSQDLPLLLAAPQAAELLGISERRFHELRREPGCPAGVLVGVRSVRWHRDELAAFAKALPRVTLLSEPKQLQAGRIAESRKAAG